MLKPTPACKDCSERKVGCQSTCGRYLEYKNDMNEFRRITREEKARTYGRKPIEEIFGNRVQIHIKDGRWRPPYDHPNVNEDVLVLLPSGEIHEGRYTGNDDGFRIFIKQRNYLQNEIVGWGHMPSADFMK